MDLEAMKAARGLCLAESETYDVIILNVMLPKIDGITVCLCRIEIPPSGDGQLIDLTPEEFAILELLMRHKGEVVTRTQITGPRNCQERFAAYF